VVSGRDPVAGCGLLVVGASVVDDSSGLRGPGEGRFLAFVDTFPEVEVDQVLVGDVDTAPARLYSDPVLIDGRTGRLSVVKRFTDACKTTRGYGATFLRTGRGGCLAG